MYNIYQGDDLSSLSPEDIRVVGAMGDSLAVSPLFHRTLIFLKSKNEILNLFEILLN